MKPWLVVAMLLSVVFAGCADAPEKNDNVAPPVDVDGTQVAGDKALVIGRVFSDAGLLVSGARVFIPGTPFDADTGVDGRFRFVNVTPGPQTLRVEADGFQVHERAIAPIAAQLLEINVTLLPAAGRSNNYLPHVHDLWRGASQVTLFDEDVDLTQKRVGSASADHDETLNYLSAALLYANKRYPKYAIAPTELEGGWPALVYPGTNKVEVTLTWNDAPPMPPTYAFGYRPADRSDEKRLDAGPSGTTWSIDVGPTQADNGHQAYTLWEFYIIPDNEVESAPDYRPSAVTETVHLTITVFKGDDPPVDPAHPTFWADGDEILIRSFDNGSYSSTGITVFGSNSKFLPMDGRIVPPGTSRLIIELEWKFDAPLPTDPVYEMYYHTARTSPNVDFWVKDWPKATLIEDGAGRRVFEVELQEGDADGYYQERSSWRFAPRPEGHDPDGMTPDHYRGRSLNVQVTALREGADVQ